jgi:addiction module RelE/StbE family toxin
VRDFKRLIRQNPQIRSSVEKALQKLSENCFDPGLKSHKLKGDLEGCWSCSIDYSNRIIFELAKDKDTNEEVINLLTLGDHDDLY